MTFVRHAKVLSPLAEDKLILRSLIGTEALGRSFLFVLELLSEDNSLDMGAIVGESMTVQLEVPGQALREFSGQVTSFSLAGGEGRFVAYRAELRPWTQLLSYTSNSRVFQFMSVPDVAKTVFREHGYSDFEERLSASYQSREYLVQYRESDFNFVSRILEQEGIYYFFSHEDGKHALILADSPVSHAERLGLETIPYFPEQEGGSRGQAHFSNWEFTRSLRTGTSVMRGFDFTRPSVDLTTARSSSESQLGEELEEYNYPGGFVSAANGSVAVRVRQEQLEQAREVFQASGNPRGLAVGDHFQLDGFPRADQNKSYLVTEAHYRIDMGSPEATGGTATEEPFASQISAIDAKQVFRALPTTRRPVVEGPQTAIVVGKAGEEIWTDEYGRVKVKFHWDRQSSGDENSSCWVRVSQLWAGPGFGGIHIPRIGQEVIVDFLEGNPDRPIITGRVYNAHNMPPYCLPENRTQSGIKSQSSLEGQVPNFNELRFEDKKGREQVFLQAEKNLETLVKDAEVRTVGSNRTVSVGVDDSLTVGDNHQQSIGSNQTISVGANQVVGIAIGQSINVGSKRSLSVGASESTSVEGSRSKSVGRSETVSIGRDQITTISGKRTHSVDQDAALTVGGGRIQSIAEDDQLSVGKRLVIDAGDEIVIQSGQASIVLTKNGDIQLKGKDILFQGSGKINVKASSDIVMKGSKIKQN